MANSIFQWLITSIVAVLHPFYVSLIELNHNPKEKTVETSIRIFTDDFEATLKKFGNTKVDLLNPINKTATDELIVKYIRNHIKVHIDNKPSLLEYVGYEIRKESVWLYFEIDNISSMKKVDIDCNLLYDYEQKQINILRVKANNDEKNYKLEYPNSNKSFQF